MPVQASELKLYKALTNNDTSANGGRMSANEAADGVKNNVWPDASQAERAAGSTKYRKTFFKVENDDDLALIDAKVFIETYTPGDDEITIAPGTDEDTQGDLTGAEQQYGAGQLDADANAGATTIDVLTEGGATRPIFADGMLIRISDKPDVDSGGNEEYLRLASSGAVAWNGNVATLTFDTGVQLANSYLAANTRVASVIEAGTVQGSISGKNITSAQGTYDETGGNLTVDHIGGVTQDWTITFTSATTFDCVGDVLGAVGSGDTTTDFAPNNPDFGKPYFTLKAAGWGGTWQSGDTLVFTTHPAAVPIWEKRVIPAGAASLSANKRIIAIDGESA